VKLVPRAGRPSPLYIAQCDGVHQPCRVGRPDQGARTRPKRPLGLMVGDQNLTRAPRATRLE
jgi:hypothetical protein